MQTKDLRYDLPPDLIAAHPCDPRDAARMLVLHRDTGRIEHRIFRDLPEYLRPNDCLVLNTTKVLPARFEVRRPTGGRIEGLFLRESSPGLWQVLLAGVARLTDGETLTFPNSPWSLTLLKRLDRGECEVRIDPPDPAATILNRVGVMPLPPYIRRTNDHPFQDDDRADYQTVYAREPGAVAAPTAGLHFTQSLLNEIGAKGVRGAEVTLHVGLGTFQPLEVDDLSDHVMHKEWYDLSPAAADTIRNTREADGRIIAVGTTSVRVLETCASAGPLTAASGWTNIFIYPPYQFRAVDMLITNFHLPESTLLALVFAFAGRDLTLHAYETAIRDQYRFFSYGDAMLIL
ncbi:MAG: tRNA preQ1(34) S-adenosylmethionine ribosyltransferase-isomerase QueA [Planctomycetota bacterium]